jgi:hypothetical protein
MPRPVLRILRDIRVQANSTLAIRLIALLDQPVRKQTARRRIAGARKRLLEGRPRAGGIECG